MFFIIAFSVLLYIWINFMDYCNLFCICVEKKMCSFLLVSILSNIARKTYLQSVIESQKITSKLFRTLVMQRSSTEEETKSLRRVIASVLLLLLLLVLYKVACEIEKLAITWKLQSLYWRL